MSEEIKADTVVEEVSAEQLNDLLSIDGSIAMLPNEEPKKPNVFSQGAPDTSFLDNPPTEDDDNPPADPAAVVVPPVDGEPPAPAEPPVDPAAILAPPSDESEAAAAIEAEKNKGGRPAALIAAAKSLVEKKILFPFDDGKKIEDYTAADFEEMIEANFQNKEATLQEQLPAQFFQNMPPEMQQAYKYIADGGQDIKSLFQAMGQSHEIRELNIADEAGQAYAVRTYLQSTNYGTAEEIEDEIMSLQDRGDLEKKAAQFKPKLDAMQQNMVNQRLAHQEQQNQQRQAQSAQYMDNVYNVLKEGKLNGIPLNERTQNMLYAGLVQPNYPSVSGKQTNLLGHLLEKYQWVEPNHELIAEALYLLSDPAGYREDVKKVGEAAVVENVVRKLKTEQSNLASSTQPAEQPDAGIPNRAATVKRPTKNFFKRD
jgi:hypothetical protein